MKKLYIYQCKYVKPEHMDQHKHNPHVTEFQTGRSVTQKQNYDATTDQIERV